MIGRRRDAVIAQHQPFGKRLEARLAAAGMNPPSAVRERRSTLGVTVTR